MSSDKNNKHLATIVKLGLAVLLSVGVAIYFIRPKAEEVVEKNEPPTNRTEFLGYAEGEMPNQPPGFYERYFQAIDKDNDGRLSEEEFNEREDVLKQIREVEDQDTSAQPFVLLNDLGRETDFDKFSRRAVPRGAFPELNNPDMADASTTEISDDESVIGLVHKGQAKAYPLSVMGRHELVNDTCGGDPVAIGWCPLCQTALVYSRQLGDKTLVFGHDGLLHRDSFVLFDRETDSLWIHSTGQCVKGEFRGEKLVFIPSMIMTWGEWKKMHPETGVLVGTKVNGPMGIFALEEAPERFGISVGQPDSFVLVPVPELRAQRVVHIEVDGTNVVVVDNTKNDFANAWESGERTFSFNAEDQLVDETGRAWDPILGTPIGEESKEHLQPVPATGWLIERWKGFYPESQIYSANEDSKADGAEAPKP